MAYYSEQQLDLIFAKARPVAGSPGYAIDCDGRIISRPSYGTSGEYGWEVDHIVPTALNGLHVLQNVRPRHWRGNSSSGGLLGGLLKGRR